MANHGDVGQEVNEMRQRLKLFALQMVSCLINALFVAAWAFLQWVVQKYAVQPLGLAELDKWMLLAFHALFALTTLVPIVCYVVVDLRKIILRTYRVVREQEASPAYSEQIGDEHA